MYSGTVKAIFFFSFTCKTSCDIELLHLVVLSIQFRDHGNEREAHDGHQRELPGHLKHEDEESGALDDAPQEDVDILGDEITDLRGVSRQP